jgi:hypothetical protein
LSAGQVELTRNATASAATHQPIRPTASPAEPDAAPLAPLAAVESMAPTVPTMPPTRYITRTVERDPSTVITSASIVSRGLIVNAWRSKAISVTTSKEGQKKAPGIRRLEPGRGKRTGLAS